MAAEILRFAQDDLRDLAWPSLKPLNVRHALSSLGRATRAAVFTPDQYSLLDFGDGRRLERFGPWCLDRPCPAAEGLSRADEPLWAGAHARFERAGAAEGRWSARPELPDRWTLAHGPLRLEVRCGPSGHVGVFPEQAANWDWLTVQLQAWPRPTKVLNLFGYTGASTLAAAAAGAEVVHVDAAHGTVAAARRNAELCGLAEAPIRWIVEDAAKFVRRELKRGNTYDAVILDPPSYGHGPRGEVWRLADDLGGLLVACGRLTAARRRFMLLTAHTPGFDPERLKRMLADALADGPPGQIDADGLSLRSTDGRPLDSGVVVRWSAKDP